MKDNKVPEVPRAIVQEVMRKGYIVAITCDGNLKIGTGSFRDEFTIREVEYALKQSIPFENYREVTKPVEPMAPNGALGLP
jgi:hypothetical protein